MGRNTVYSFGIDMAAARDWTADAEFKLHVVKSRTDRENHKLEFRTPNLGKILGRTRHLGMIDEGNFRLFGTETGRFSSATPNVSSLPRVSFDPDVDDVAMQMICEKAGEPTNMTDPFLLLKHRDRPYGDKLNLAYS